VTTAETAASRGDDSQSPRPSLSRQQPEAAEPGRRGLPGVLAWLPTRDLITTKILEIRKRRGLMITMVVMIVLPAVLILGFRLLFHAIDSRTYGPAGNPGVFSDVADLLAEFGFIAAAALGAAVGTTDLSDGMFRHLVITGRSRLALYLARIPAGLAIIVPLVALAVTMTCLVTSYEGSPNPTSVPMEGLSVPLHLDQAELTAWLLERPQQVASSGFQLGPATPVGQGASAAPLGPGASAASVRRSIDKNIATIYGDYVDTGLEGANPADNEMVKIGLWLELEAGIGFLVGLGFGSLTGQRTTTTIVLIAVEIIVTPLLARVQLPYFINGQRLVVGIAMDQLRPAALGPGIGGGAGGGGPGHVLFGGSGALGIPPMPTWAMISVIVGWIVGWSVIGAWRMATRDA
jgi:hypothetical protein